MKDILIFGVPRAGKTTLSKLLIEELRDYHIFSIDAIRNAFGDIFPELEINDKGGKNNEIILPNYVSRLLYWQHDELRNKQGYIIEGCQVLPDKVKEVFDLENSIVIYLGHGTLCPEDILKNIRKYDTPEEYSYKRDDETMLKQCREYYEIEKINIAKCKKYGFIYVDTSTNRKEVLRKLVNQIKSIVGEFN